MFGSFLHLHKLLNHSSTYSSCIMVELKISNVNKLGLPNGFHMELEKGESLK